MISYIIITAVSVLLLAADQITKVLIDSGMTEATDEIVVIKDFFSITNLHNTGAAWGMLNSATAVLAVLSVTMAAVLIFVYVQEDSVLVKLSTALIITGAVGNVIDRIRLHYVVDFLRFYNLFGFYEFPTFNIADICVTSGVIGLLIYVIFVSSKKKAFRENTILYKWFYANKGKKDKKEDSSGTDGTAEN